MKYWQIFYIDSNGQLASLPEEFYDQHLALNLCRRLNKVSSYDQYKVIEVER